MKTRLISFVLVAIMITTCNNNESETTNWNTSAPNINYTFTNYYPHDINSFTEGLLFHNGELYESTGATENLLQTKSLFGKVDLKTGKINTLVELDRTKYFGEGISFLNGKVFQLTYKNEIGFVYDAIHFKKIREFTIPTNEGWGLTNDGFNLIMSDGTNILTFIDPETLRVIKKLDVTENGFSISNLNELEYIKGYIYANIWTTNFIVKIDAKDGKIIGKLDLTILTHEARELYSNSKELNGIAYDSITDKILVTGKLWPKIYEIKFSH
jgi:glutamine cyclotransferase